MPEEGHGRKRLRFMQQPNPTQPGPADRLTVMQIIPALESGGAELGTVQVAEALCKAGHRALVVSRGGRMETPIHDCGKLIRLDVASKNPLTIIANGVRLALLARREGVDVLHVRSRAPSWSTLIASKLTGIPYIGTYHTIYREQSGLKNLYNSAVVRGARVIAVGDETAAVMRQRYPFLPETRIVTIHRGVDLQVFDPAAVTAERKAALAEAWRLPEGAEVALLPGRIVHRKGHHVFIRAIHRLVEGGRDDLVGVCAGDDQGKSRYRDEMEALVASLGLNDHIRFVGHCEDMPAAYVLSRVAVSAAVESEGLQRAILEAQAMGVPVVVSDVGSGIEVVRAMPRVPEGEITGYNVQAGDPEALAEAIDRVLRLAPADYDALSGRASAWARGSFSHEVFTAKTLALYREVVDEARGASAAAQKA
ncbi:glycosyl transferase [Blastochloris tepida]|uniref:Glycosyl transferase n=2 Tax=Blastochloris tepida TaxID=2233851 RepID=A0A348G3I2_9HYPH|nr:glycosyl transferase [Blastochloris tepida]